MKTLIFCISITAVTLIFQACSTAATNYFEPQQVSEKSAPEEYNYLLEKYVTPSGVHYLEWSNHTEDLNKLKSVTDYYAQNSPPRDKQESLAWHLNAYNAWILQNILQDWPNEGPLDVSVLFFHKKSITISGKYTSFQHLENDIIRKEFNEPRIHFALNCASRSCPPLHAKPFKAATLDKTLQQLTDDFINKNSLALEESNDLVELSKIFEWYEEDFGGKDQLLSYINQYRDQKIATDKKVKFLSYDWSLNKAL